MITILFSLLSVICNIAMVQEGAEGGDCHAAADSGWVLHTDDYVTDDYTGVPVANGMLGILPWKEPFSVRHIMLNGVSDRLGQDQVNSTVRGINPFGLSMAVDGIETWSVSEWNQSLDIKEARHVTEFVADGKVKVRYSFAALRNLPYSMIMDVEVSALEDAAVEFNNRMHVPQEYCMAERDRKSYWIEGKALDVLRTSAKTAGDRYDVAAASAFILDVPPSGITGASAEADRTASSSTGAGTPPVRAGTPDKDIIAFPMKKGEARRFSLVASVCSTADFSDPWNETVRQIVYIDRVSVDEILAGHRADWAELWESDIVIEGDMEAQRAVRLALFSLYGSCAEGSRLSIPPMGLSSRGYNGHIFWDAEMWMFPPLLLMNQGMAESMMNYRLDRLKAAEERAAASGYKGAMFPWESDEFGEESTPVWALTGPMEHHITADVGIAAWNYWCVTRDREWLKDKGWPLLKGVAEFWADRVRANDDGTYSITGVVGADEYANNVTDNAFTNGAVSKVLEYAMKAARLSEEKAPSVWKEISEGLRILRNGDGVTMEYEGYGGQKIKQADVNLLGYPLGVITGKEQLLRDLEYYEGKVDPVDGPAMTWSIFCVQYARLGDMDKAFEMFLRCYRPFSRPPFGALAETPASDNPYFVTAAGGLLQAVLSGFGGIEITDRGIVCRKAILPPPWKKLTVKGIGPDRRTIEIHGGRPGL